jgi:hypothetical protein
LQGANNQAGERQADEGGRKPHGQRDVEERHDGENAQIHDGGRKRDAGLSIAAHTGIGLRLARQHHRGCGRRIKPAQSRHPQAARGGGPIALRQVTRIGQAADHDQRQPGVARRDGGECRHRLVRQQRQHDAGQDQKFTGGDDFVDVDAPRQRVKLLAPGEQQNGEHRESHRKPGRQSERNGTEKISVDVERRYDDPDIRLAFVVGLADVLTVEDREPGAEHDQSGGERNEMGRVEQIKHAAGGGEDRKRANAAGAADVAVGEKVLIGEAEKQAQPDQERCAAERRCRNHRSLSSRPSWQLDWTYHK